MLIFTKAIYMLIIPTVNFLKTTTVQWAHHLIGKHEFIVLEFERNNDSF